LWCIDRNPTEVDYDWIKRNAFQLKRTRDAAGATAIPIGAYTLRRSEKPGKLWMTAPSGQGAEIDEKVLEDLFKTFF
jgi:hypothetical protein